MKRNGLYLMAMGMLLALPVTGYADVPTSFTWDGVATAPTVDFDTWMYHLANRYVTLLGGYPYAYLDPAVADNNGNFILDVDELFLVKAICLDTSHPMHDMVHEGFKANVTRLETDLGPLIASLMPPLKLVMAGYMLLGDGSYTRALVSFEGSVGIVAETIYEMRDYGSGWNIGAPNLALYNLLPATLSWCGDFDGDGVNNVQEYYGQYMYRDAWLAAVSNPSIQDCGTGPGACAGNNKGCVIPGIHFMYVPATGKVYLVASTAMTWVDAQVYAENLTIGGVPYPSNLMKISNADENALAWSIASRVGTAWIGATDQDEEGVWRWIATGEQFWQGDADGSAVGGLYANWRGGEPNNSGGNEHWAEIRSGDGLWNDAGVKTRPAIIEVAGTFADANGNGIPDAFEPLLCGRGGCEGEGAGLFHSADQNGDNRINLSELLRVVQFYNSGGYHCGIPPESTEDGYVPGPNAGQQGCGPHSSDYNPQDWLIIISELLRVIQFYNAGGYYACPGEGTWDGFCAGSLPEN